MPSSLSARARGGLGELAGVTIGSALGVLAAVRRGKALHPDGVVYAAELVVPERNPGSPDGRDAPEPAVLFRQPGSHPAVVRFSRSVGVPRPIPDLLGMAIRVLDAYGPGQHQDLLLTSSADHPVLHHLFLPARDLQERPYSSSLPYAAGHDRFLIGALPDPRSPRPSGDDEFDRLDAAARTGEVRFQIATAPVDGRFTPVAELRIAERLGPEADALRFNPWTTGGGLEPAGWLNDARRIAYPLSQRIWRGVRPDGERLQQDAERAVEAVAD